MRSLLGGQGAFDPKELWYWNHPDTEVVRSGASIAMHHMMDNTIQLSLVVIVDFSRLGKTSRWKWQHGDVEL